MTKPTAAFAENSAALRVRPAQRAEADAYRPLRICLLGYRSNPYSGGQGVYLRYLSRALTQAGHRVDVISGEPYPELDAAVRLIKMPGLNLHATERRLLALRPRHLRSATDLLEWGSTITGGFPEPYTFGRRVLGYLIRHRHDYDLVHDNQSLCRALLALQGANIPTVATIHHPITHDLQIMLASARHFRHRALIRRWYAFVGMQRRVVRNLRHLVTVSERSRADLSTAFGLDAARINVVRNGVDTHTFKPLPGIRRKRRQLLATASADAPLKGLDYLLHALARLRKRYPDLKLAVVGQPRPGGHTEKVIRNLELGSAVRFMGGVPTAELVELYAESTLAVVPSLYEGFGLPAGEAMACGVPVVATTGGALPEVVGDCGVLAPPADAPALAACIGALLEDGQRRRRLGASGRQRIAREFSWDVAARDMTAFYRGVLAGANGRA